MNESDLTPLQRAVIRNYALRKARWWGVFRELAGGDEVPGDALNSAEQLLRQAEDAFDRASYFSFRLPDEREEAMTQANHFLGPTVLVCQRDRTGDILHHFLAQLDRVWMALPGEIEQPLYLMDSFKTVLELVEGRTWDGRFELRLRALRRREHSLWLDLSDEDFSEDGH